MRLSAKYPDVPGFVLEELERYVNERQEPWSDFVWAVLRNDLARTIGLADQACLAALLSIVRIVYNEVPSACWGTPERVTAWLTDETRAA